MRIEEQGKCLADALHRMKGIDYWRLIPDMTPAEIQVLAAVCGGCEGEQKISDLYEVCGMLPAAVSRLMNILEEKELIVRNTRKGNRRVTDVFATDRGKQVNARNLSILHGYWKEVLENVASEDVDTMLRIQQEMMDSMEAVLARKMQALEEQRA